MNANRPLWFLCACALLLGGACSDDGNTTPALQEMSLPRDSMVLQDTVAPRDAAVGDLPTATGNQVEFVTTLGNFTIELDAAKAPLTVANFLTYVKAGFYDGTIFHRVIPTFMIQGGGFDATYTKKPTNPSIQNEADNGLSNLRGSVAMARTSDPHSATSQFFVNVVDNSGLDHTAKTTDGWGYCVFGKVIAGLDTIDKIKAVPTGPGGPFAKDAPQTPVVITSAKLR